MQTVQRYGFKQPPPELGGAAAIAAGRGARARAERERDSAKPQAIGRSIKRGPFSVAKHPYRCSQSAPYPYAVRFATIQKEPLRRTLNGPPAPYRALSP